MNDEPIYFEDEHPYSGLPDTALNYALDGDVHVFIVVYSNLVSDGSLCFAFSTPSDPSVVVITKNEEIV